MAIHGAPYWAEPKWVEQQRIFLTNTVSLTHEKKVEILNRIFDSLTDDEEALAFFACVVSRAKEAVPEFVP